jgi:SAM-dependent methyltransferase
MSSPSESHLDFYRRWHRLSAPYIAWQFEQFRPFLGRRVADIGCGLGNFTHLLLDRDLVLGVDQDEELLAELRRENPSPVVQTLSEDILAPGLATALREQAVDTVLCVNVLEHLPDDHAAVRNLLDGLPVGGHLCVLVPAMPVLFGTLDTLDGHYRRYTKPLLAKLFLEYLGRLKMERLYYFNAAGVLGWFLKGRILKQKTHTNDNYHLMNLLIPLVRPTERMLTPPFGMSLVAIATKTDDAA